MNLPERFRNTLIITKYIALGWWNIFDSEKFDHWVKLLSALWVIFWVVAAITFEPPVVDDKVQKMGLNEWGDFFAGAFAPLAFLWLVLGYFQQSKELRLNTEALKLQAQELSNSVGQQEALVKVAKAEFESALSSRQAEEFQKNLETIPVIEYYGVEKADGEDKIFLKNNGETVVSVDAVLDPVMNEADVKLGDCESLSWDKGGLYFVTIVGDPLLEAYQQGICLIVSYRLKTGAKSYSKVKIAYDFESGEFSCSSISGLHIETYKQHRFIKNALTGAVDSA